MCLRQRGSLLNIVYPKASLDPLLDGARDLHWKVLDLNKKCPFGGAKIFGVAQQEFPRFPTRIILSRKKKEKPNRFPEVFNPKTDPRVLRLVLSSEVGANRHHATAEAAASRGRHLAPKAA